MLPIEIEEKIDEIKNQISQQGADLVEISARCTTGRNILTVIVDKDGGITLDECADINRRLSVFFDELSQNAQGGFFAASYFLEVNSPGLDRPLKAPKDYSKAKGKTLRVIVKDASGKTFYYVGRLADVDENGIHFELQKKKEILFFPFSNILQAVREISV